MKSETRVTLWVAISATAILAGHVLTPFNLDNDLYQAIGFQLVRFHRLPYIGSFDQNFPGIMYIHAGIIALLGNNEISFRLFETLLHIASATILFVILRRWISARVAALSALLGCVYYNFGGVWFGGQRDGIAFFFVLAAALLLYRIKDGHSNEFRRWKGLSFALIMGLLVGIATLIRPTNGLFALVLLIALWLVGGQKKYAFTAVYIIGILSVWIAAFAPYFGISGGFSRVYDSIILFNTEVYTASKNNLTFIEAVKKPQEIFVNLVLLATLAYLFFVRKGNRRRSLGQSKFSPFDIFLIIGFYLSARIPIILMGKLLGYQFEAVVTMSLVPIALALDSMFSLLKSHVVSCLAPVVFIIALTIMVYPWHYVFTFFEGVFRGVDDPVTYSHITRPQTWFDTLLVSDYRVAQFLRAPGNSDGRIECQGAFASVYWRSEREPASSFTVIYPLAMTGSSGKANFQKKWAQEFMDSLRVVKPVFLIMSKSRFMIPLFYKYPPNVELSHMPGFDSLLESSYKHDTDIGVWSIYRAKH